MKNELGITKGGFTVEEYGHCIAIEVKIKDGTIHTVFTDQFCHASRFDGTGKDNAILVAEAFNVANETGKTPRQLADDNKVLLEALQNMRVMYWQWIEQHPETQGYKWAKEALSAIKQVTE